MPNRRWPRDVFRAALFCAALLVIALAVNWWAGGVACFNELRVGMPGREACAIMERNGYKLVGGGGNAMENVLVFSRNKAEPPIVLIIASNGILTGKEQDSVPDYFLQSLSDHIRGYSR